MNLRENLPLVAKWKFSPRQGCMSTLELDLVPPNPFNTIISFYTGNVKNAGGSSSQTKAPWLRDKVEEFYKE